MANTFILIEAITLGATAQSVTFSAIPGTYTDLVLKISARSNDTGNYEPIRFQFNGDTATNYSDTSLYTYETTNGSARETSKVAGTVQYALASSGSTPSTAFGNSEIYIPSYGVAINKPIAGRGTSSSSTGQSFQSMDAGLWRNTAAITSIKIMPHPTLRLFSIGSSFYLYGIKNS